MKPLGNTETFYSHDQAGALRIARAWAARVGCEIAQDEEGGRAAMKALATRMTGGGSTAIAALELDRRFIGIDVDEHAIRTTAARIAELDAVAAA